MPSLAAEFLVELLRTRRRAPQTPIDILRERMKIERLPAILASAPDGRFDATGTGGASAGGGLASATVVALRGQGDPLPAGAVCFSPWVDLEGCGESMITNAETDPTIELHDLLLVASLYLGGADPRTPLAAPLHTDL